MLTNSELMDCKNSLLQRQSKLIQQIQDHYGLAIEAREAADELSTYDNHPADMATASYERGKDIALNEHAEQELEEINEALHAINDGTYGVCTTCGMDIPFERLQAVPTTDKCISHANEEVGAQRERPVEEEVMQAHINPNHHSEEEQVGYDAEDAWQEVSRYGTSETPSDLYGDRDNYNEMYPNDDEQVGGVEQIEEIALANIDGERSDDSTI